MVPLIRNLKDIQDVTAKLPYTSNHDRKPTAEACHKALKKLHAIGQVPIGDYVSLKRELERFVG